MCYYDALSSLACISLQDCSCAGCDDLGQMLVGGGGGSKNNKLVLTNASYAL